MVYSLYIILERGVLYENNKESDAEFTAGFNMSNPMTPGRNIRCGEGDVVSLKFIGKEQNIHGIDYTCL